MDFPILIAVVAAVVFLALQLNTLGQPAQKTFYWDASTFRNSDQMVDIPAKTQRIVFTFPTADQTDLNNFQYSQIQNDATVSQDESGNNIYMVTNGKRVKSPDFQIIWQQIEYNVDPNPNQTYMELDLNSGFAAGALNASTQVVYTLNGPLSIDSTFTMGWQTYP